MSVPQDLAEAILSKHSDAPQHHGLASLALSELNVALAMLARLGHRLQVQPMPETPAMEFPKWVYAPDNQGRVVENQAEQDEALMAGFGEMPEIGRASCRERVSSPV